MRNFISMTPRCRQFSAALAIATFAVAGVGSATAQSVDFQINNWSLEQIVVSEQAPLPAYTQPMTDTSVTATGSLILQNGIANRAEFYVAESAESGTVSYQLGQQNITQGVILESPGSTIAQFQLGEANRSDVAIVGGRDNAVATVQVGNRLGVAVGLLNSEGTTIVYGQAGQDYNGGVVFANAPAGTVITLN